MILNVDECAWDGACDVAWGASDDARVVSEVFGLLRARVLGEAGVIWRLNGRMLGRVLGRVLGAHYSPGSEASE